MGWAEKVGFDKHLLALVGRGLIPGQNFLE